MYTREVFGPRLQNVFNAWVQLTTGLCGMAVNLLSIGVNHYRFYIWLSLLSTSVCAIPLLWFTESPRFYFYRKRVNRLTKSLLSIAQVNHARDRCRLVKFEILSKLHFGTREAPPGNPRRTVRVPCEPKRDSFSFLVDRRLEDKIFSDDIDRLEPRFEWALLFRPHNLRLFLHYTVIIISAETMQTLSLIVNSKMGIQNVFLGGCLVNLLIVASSVCSLVFFKEYQRRTINTQTTLWSAVLSLVLLMANVASNLTTPYSQRHVGLRVLEAGKSHQRWDWRCCFFSTLSSILFLSTAQSFSTRAS